MRSVDHSGTARLEAVLDRICEQARESAVPELDVASIEARVLERVTHSRLDTLVVPRSRTSKYLVLAAALAAAVALVVLGSEWRGAGKTDSVVTDRVPVAQAPKMDGSALHVGQILEAPTENLTVSHPGIVTWRLFAPARARVVETGSRISIALDNGRIEAEVVPKPQPEVFAIEVEHVRVAVHGTVFSVQRVGDVAEVVVKEGIVRVVSTGQDASAKSQLLVAPARLSVDIRPNTGDAKPNDNRSRLASKVAPVNSSKSTPPNLDPKVEPAAPLPARPVPQEIERIWELAAQEISDCFASQPGGDPNVRVSFVTQVNIQLGADGRVNLTSFNPPVPQPFLGCSEQRIQRLQTQPSTEGATISRAKMLTR